MYKVLGSDGTEYGPISADKINQWIREKRVNQKTPVMPDGTDEWIFLGKLPEFAEGFASLGQVGNSDATNNRRRLQLAICLGLLLVALVIGALFILGKVKHH
jgi:hypothetical protein